MAAEERLATARRELYVGDPAAFVGRRAALVKQAKAAGDKELAAAIGALRKPSKSASLLNRFAAAHPERVQELLDLGGSLRRAERDLDANTLRALTQRRRALIGALGREVGAGASGGVAEEITATLNAALADDTVAVALQQATVAEAAEWDGFGLGGPALAVLPGGRATAPPPADEPTATRPAPEHEATSTEADRDGPPPAGARATAGKAGAQAERQRMRDEADQARARMEQTRTRARADADRAAQALSVAEQSETAASRRVSDLQQEIERLTDELDRQTAELTVAQSQWRQAQSARRAATLLAQRTAART